MNILRLSAITLTIVLFTMGALILPANTALAEHCKGKHKNDPGCDDPGGDPSAITYTAELKGAFVFGPLPVSLEGRDERLINSDDVTMVSPDGGNAFELNAWNDVLEVCGLLLHPIPEVTASGGKKGWRIARPGGVYIQFPMQPLPSNGYGDLDVNLQLIGDCSYSSAGTTVCQPFPPVPGVNGGISEIVLTHFNIHAKGEKNILHSLDTCHSDAACGRSGHLPGTGASPSLG